MSAAPLVSVVVPAYNAERYLAAAVDSVLGQTLRDLELIVVDDGSSDGTPALLEAYGGALRRLRQPNAGVSAARNRGIEHSRGRYLAILDADDVWLPHKLERQLEALAARPGCRACYSAFTVVDAALRPLRVHRGAGGGRLLDALLTGNVVGCSNVIWERRVFDEVGGFDPGLSQCADWDMWLRVAAVADFAYVDEPLMLYRLHGANMSRDVERLERDSVRVLEKAFARPELPAPLAARRRAALGHNAMVLAGSYFQAGRWAAFLRWAVRALILDPRQAAYLLAFPARAWTRMFPPGDGGREA